MIINNNNLMPFESVQMAGAKDVTTKILIGPKNDSNNIIMRYFKIMPGGNTPLHAHNYEHLIKIEKGKGIVVDENGKKHEINVGQSLFVEPNEKHQFQNPYNEPFEFICLIPNPEKNNCTIK